MSVDDDYYDDDGDDALAEMEAEAAGDGGEDGGGTPAHKAGVRDWVAGKRGWLLILGLAFAQGLFAVIMLYMRSEATPPVELQALAVKDLAVEMLGHEVAIRQINQLLPARRGKRLSVALDVVLVLGQLPEEQVEGAPRPNPAEFALFVAAVQDMEPRIRSRINSLLQKTPPEALGTTEIYRTIKDDVKNYVNDALAGLNFGDKLRPGIGKRRVTEVLLPMFVRQYY